MGSMNLNHLVIQTQPTGKELDVKQIFATVDIAQVFHDLLGPNLT